MQATGMIFDGPRKFPNSCVKFTHFKCFELRQMFAMLREKEEVLQKDLRSVARDSGKFLEIQFRLEEIQAHLCWMAHNITGSDSEKMLRRSGIG